MFRTWFKVIKKFLNINRYIAILFDSEWEAKLFTSSDRSISPLKVMLIFTLCEITAESSEALSAIWNFIRIDESVVITIHSMWDSEFVEVTLKVSSFKIGSCVRISITFCVSTNDRFSNYDSKPHTNPITFHLYFWIFRQIECKIQYSNVAFLCQ